MPCPMGGVSLSLWACGLVAGSLFHSFAPALSLLACLVGACLPALPLVLGFPRSLVPCPFRPCGVVGLWASLHPA